ncbi:acyl-CoA dehydrogenase family protein [Nocardia harenae]|uniref:acyl-CoA dehydrogenase family protein n=1 Tax=Nocardia harenae TaxID=358707 RepID=UPI00083361C7|nr:acyl-CoA dehydrogenase family protein [Nocardia harenae]
MTPRLTPEAETEELRRVVRGFLAKHTGTAGVLREPARSQGWDAEVWRRLAVELGVAALDVPEDLGGAGASFREVGIVAEELGRCLVRLPWFSTAVLGVGVLLHTAGAGETHRTLLDRLATAEATATLAYREEFDGGPAGAVATEAIEAADGWRLTGTKTLVVEGTTADVLFVVARDPAGTSIYVVDGAADGLRRTAMPTLDPTRPLARLVLDRVPAVRLGRAGAAPIAVQRVLDRARAALACEQVGGAAAAMELSVAHASSRVQFGRPIGTFQAIKHRCADMALLLDSARSAALWAVAAAADDGGELPLAATTAALACADAYTWISAETVQVHGGMGFTWEHPAHLHVRRAATGAVLFGTGNDHRERLLDLLEVR